tara:strand:+ start:4432 stop:5370 length:939 start_codon:yes stop_codon:yes gene_type:complete
MRIIKIFLIAVLFNLNILIDAYSLENKILLKIDNQIITSIDVYNETKYLLSMNEKFNEMKQEDIYKISINYLIREKIKKIEIQKNISDKLIEVDEDYINQLIESTYKRKGYQNLKDFKLHLDKYGVKITDIKEKINIESLWNELIYKKFSNKVRIDRNELENKVMKDNNKLVNFFLLSEIFFKQSDSQSLDQKFNLIKKDINEKGFTKAVLIHSISDTAVNGGDLGWIAETSLSPKIKNEITKLKVGNFTDPIIIPGGFLILKLNESKSEKKEYDVEKKVNELIRLSTNQQLNRLSNIYYDKIKKEIKIDEL